MFFSEVTMVLILLYDKNVGKTWLFNQMRFNAAAQKPFQGAFSQKPGD
jgi:hypothetical protein